MTSCLVRVGVLVLWSATKAMANPAMTPWITTGQSWVQSITSGYVPLIMACIMVGVLVAAWRFGDQEGWIGSLLKVGVLTAAAANALTWTLMWSAGAGGVAAATIEDVLEPIMHGEGW